MKKQKNRERIAQIKSVELKWREWLNAPAKPAAPRVFEAGSIQDLHRIEMQKQEVSTGE